MDTQAAAVSVRRSSALVPMTDTDSEDERAHGIEFDGLRDCLGGLSYPASTETVVESCGHQELEMGSESQRLADVLEPLGEQTFDSPDAVEETLLTAVGDDAVGREGYSDRGGADEDGTGEDDQESL